MHQIKDEAQGGGFQKSCVCGWTCQEDTQSNADALAEAHTLSQARQKAEDVVSTLRARILSYLKELPNMNHDEATAAYATVSQIQDTLESMRSSTKMEERSA